MSAARTAGGSGAAGAALATQLSARALAEEQPPVPEHAPMPPTQPHPHPQNSASPTSAATCSAIGSHAGHGHLQSGHCMRTPGMQVGPPGA